MEEECNHVFKIVLVGNSQTGKSCILNRYVKNSFRADTQPTVGVEFNTTMMNINGLIIKLQIWDTAGQQRFRSLISSYNRGAHGFIFVFDLTHAESFRALSNWINQMNGDSSERKPAIIVGNKSDLESHRQVTFEEAKQFAEENGMNYIEVSAERDHNIKQLFDLIARELVSKLA